MPVLCTVAVLSSTCGQFQQECLFSSSVHGADVIKPYDHRKFFIYSSYRWTHLARRNSTLAESGN
jgi:hypothetical protein